MQRIRTLSEIEFEVPLISATSFKYQVLREKAKKLRKLGMSYKKIGEALGVDGKLTKKAVEFDKQTH